MYELIVIYFSGFLGKVELAGTIFALICVYLAVKHNMWTWFWGALGVICFGYLFYAYKLYSDAGLQILFYLPLQYVGWRVWQKESICAANAKVTFGLEKATVMVITLAITSLSIVTGYLMSTYTDASFPYVDALTTWMSVFAQILMIKKFWESWVLWVGMDFIAIFVYALKGLYVTSGLYFFFLILASKGLYDWYKDYKEQNSVGEVVNV